jgi:phosphoglucomutase/phosphomannomutase
MPGAEGMTKMREVMTALRERPPTSLADCNVLAVRDYLNLKTVRPVEALAKHPAVEPLDAPRGDMVILELEPPGNYVAVRPSGTEPKIKFYLFAYEPAEMLADLADTKGQLDERLSAVARQLGDFSRT